MPLKGHITVCSFLVPLPSFFLRPVSYLPCDLAISRPAIESCLSSSMILTRSFSSAVFAGKDASRALALSSLKIEDCRPEWEDLADKEKQVLNDWFTFFSKRYNIVGKVRR